MYGARQVGKTTLLKQLFLGREDAIIFNCEQPQVFEILESKDINRIMALFDGRKYIVLDEAQKVFDIGSILKLLYDDDQFDCQLITSGSSSFELANRVSEPLTGRNIKFRLYPLSLDEMKDNKGWLWVLEQLNELLIYGSYPGIIALTAAEKEIKIQELSGDYLFRDVLAFQNIKNSFLG